METLFSKIISGEISSYKIAEDASCYAFLDINPNVKGHVLCVPKKPADKLFDLPEEDYKLLMNFARPAITPRLSISQISLLCAERVMMLSVRFSM